MKKVFKLTMHIVIFTAAIAVAVGIVYLYCAMEWEESLRQIDIINNGDLVKEIAWKYKNFHEYLLVRPLHWVAAFLLTWVFAFFFASFFCNLIEKHERKLQEKIKIEKSKINRLYDQLDELESEIKQILHRIDLLPKGSTMRPVYYHRVNSLMEDSRSVKLEISSSIYRIGKMEEDIENLDIF